MDGFTVVRLKDHMAGFSRPDVLLSDLYYHVGQFTYAVRFSLGMLFLSWFIAVRPNCLKGFFTLGKAAWSTDLPLIGRVNLAKTDLLLRCLGRAVYLLVSSRLIGWFTSTRLSDWLILIGPAV
jgi:hypothetical protein